MITPMTLHAGVCDFLEKEVAAKTKLMCVDPQGNESVKCPCVIRSGWPLPKSIDGDTDGDTGGHSDCEVFPYILPRISKIEHGGGEATATLDILFGVYGPGAYDSDGNLVDDGSGYRDLWNLMEATRQALFTQHTIGSKYRILDDYFIAETIPENIQPYWEGYCRTKWHVAMPAYRANSFM